MAPTISLFVLATILVLQYATCLPAETQLITEEGGKAQNDSSAVIETESEDSNAIPHGTVATPEATLLPAASVVPRGRKRFTTVLYEYPNKYINFQLRGTYQIAEDVLADPSISSVHTNAMEKEKAVLEKYVKDAKETSLAVLPPNEDNQQNRYFFIIGKSFLLDEFNRFARGRSPDVGDLTSEQKMVWEALVRHGLLEFRAETQKREQELGCHIADEFEKYVKSLSPAEKEKEKQVVEFFDGYIQHQDTLEKAQFGHNLFLMFF